MEVCVYQIKQLARRIEKDNYGSKKSILKLTDKKEPLWYRVL
jgi:hypothetical protein